MQRRFDSLDGDAGRARTRNADDVRDVQRIPRGISRLWAGGILLAWTGLHLGLGPRIAALRMNEYKAQRDLQYEGEAEEKGTVSTLERSMGEIGTDEIFVFERCPSYKLYPKI